MRYFLAAPFAATLLLAQSCGYFGPEAPEAKAKPHFDIPVVDEQKAKANAAARQPQPTCPSAQQAPAAQASPFGTEHERAQVREWIRKLMDETRVVPDTAARKGGPRGSAGSFAKLTSQQVEEFVSAIIYAGDRFSPQSLPADQKRVLVAAEISIESAFTPGTSGDNPGNQDGGPHYVSVGPLQLTLNQDPSGKGMWDDIFRQYAKLPGLTHADGSPWDPASTTREQFCNTIFDSVVSAYWCITEQARRGIPDWFGGPNGPMPATMKNAFLGWVIGCQALRSGGDLAGQRDFYLASISTDLKLLGYDPALIESAF